MITLDQIAQKCGVSKMTVSRALGRDSHRVSPDKLKIILETADKYNYRQNRLANSFNTGRTQLVAYLASEFRHFQSNVFAGVQAALVPQGYDILAMQWSQTLRKGDRLLESIVDRRVEGVMLFHQGPHCDYSYLEDLQKHGIPVVVVDRDVNVPDLGFVGLDNIGGSVEATNHLLSLGHRNIAFISRDEDWGYSSTLERYKGYEMAMNEAGFSSLESIIIPEKDYKGNDASSVAKEIQKMNVTAVICDNDVVAAFCILNLADLGYSVPEQLSVVGFGNISGYVDLIRPKLTTVDLDPYKIGVEASGLLMDMISVKYGEKQAELLGDCRRILPTELIVRDSTYKL
ncbi:MAG: LacI family DNA-binding transcriptional regulator [Sedimentisphaeraceae bacterium JB056]